MLAGRRIRCALAQPIDNPGEVSVSIRPESIRIGSLQPDDGEARGGANCLPGRVSGVTFLGASRRIDVVSDGVDLQVAAPSDLALPPDGEVRLLFDPERAVVLPGRAS